MEIEIFAAAPIAGESKRTRERERERDSARFISLYIVHCNYNLYLLVIDTFIDRLLLLVASVISQAQISETGEPRETLFFPRGFVASPSLSQMHNFLSSIFPFFMRVTVATGLSYKMFIDSRG